MAQKVEGFPPRKTHRRSAPWAQWADGAIWQVDASADLPTPRSQANAEKALRSWAKNNGYKVSCRKTGTTSITFQLVDRNADITPDVNTDETN